MYCTYTVNIICFTLSLNMPKPPKHFQKIMRRLDYTEYVNCDKCYKSVVYTRTPVYDVGIMYTTPSMCNPKDINKQDENEGRL